MASQNDLYQSVTDQIIAALEAGTPPWIKPWRADGRGGALPHNGISGRPYHGVNVLLLSAAEVRNGYEAPIWLTYRQATQRGGHVRKGERGQLVCFWKFNTYKKTGDDGTESERKSCMLRTYHVFNIAQCEDVELPAPRGRADVPARDDLDPLIARVGADIRHGGDIACYTVGSNRVTMPTRQSFKSTDYYYAVLLHELTHWTGHKARCDRNLSGRFGSEAYAAEELVAEIGSAFMCAHLGVPLDTLQHPAYVASWLKVLRNDNRAIFTASRLAQTASDFMLDRMFDRATDDAREAA